MNALDAHAKLQCYSTLIMSYALSRSALFLKWYFQNDSGIFIDFPNLSLWFQWLIHAKINGTVLRICLYMCSL